MAAISIPCYYQRFFLSLLQFLVWSRRSLCRSEKTFNHETVKKQRVHVSDTITQFVLPSGRFVEAQKTQSNLGWHLAYSYISIFSYRECVCTIQLQICDGGIKAKPVIHKYQWIYAAEEHCFLADQRAKSLPCFWCAGICPILLHRCLQRHRVKDRCLSYWHDRCGLKIPVTIITMAKSHGWIWLLAKMGWKTSQLTLRVNKKGNCGISVLIQQPWEGNNSVKQ